MSNRLAPARVASRRRVSWAIFCGLWAVGIGMGLVFAMDSSRSSVGLLVLGGLVAMGVSAVILHSLLSPIRDYDGRAQGRGSGAIAAAGIFDGGSMGGGSAGGDGGGASGC